MKRVIAIALAAGLLAAVLSSCGGGGTTTVIKKTTAPTPSTNTVTTTSTATTSATTSISTPTPTSTAGTSSCGGGISVGPNTSCPFAVNVKQAYDQSGGGNVLIHAFSPTTGKTYEMACGTTGGTIVCTGGNGASVFFPG